MIVTHNLQQAFRVADHVAFMHLGELVEYGTSEQVFDRPAHAAHARLHQRGLRVRLAALALAALALTGCESTQEQSAKLEQAAKRHEHEAAGSRRARRSSIAQAEHATSR